ncbi:MAG: hypothetical protein HRU38_16105 [Saccharospirillaceae bacterium]|nr:hypothetical protein [Pseudomonadales bacterium]NRB80166.1 hypothetical protein [Saccharospirillaceae bacterium]
MKITNKNQSGMSIISMLIATVISSLVLISTFSLFKTITKISIEQSNSAKYEGDISEVLLLIQQEVQSAGYKSNQNNHILVEKIGGLYQIYWRYSELGGSPYTCRGLVEKLVEENNRTSIELHFMQPSDKCTAKGNLKAMQWDISTNIIKKFNNINKSIFSSITLKLTKCSAFMVGDNTRSHQTLNISINSSVVNVTRDMSICLINL